MHAFIGPILLVFLGALTMAATTRVVRSEELAKRADPALENMRLSFTARALLVVPMVFGAYALYGVLAAIWGGLHDWWTWLTALTVQLAAVYHGQRARERFTKATAIERMAPTAEDSTRSRFTCLYLAGALVGLLVVQLLLPAGGAQAPTWRVITSALLLVVTMASLCAAGFSAVWVFRTGAPHGRAL